MSSRGSAAVDYVGAVCAVAVVMAALVTVRGVVADRTPPVRPDAPLVKLLDVLRDPPARQRPPARPRIRRRTPPPPPIVVDLPRWFA